VSSARRGAVVPLAIAVGGVLLASAPAHATVRATWSKPTDNATFTSNSPIEFSVSLDRGLVTDGAAVNLNLAVPGPNPGPFRVDVASGSDRDLKFTFTPACPNHAAACPSGSPFAYNGRYTASLSGATTGSRSVVLQVPPAAPAGVVATATGQRRVKVSWEANREPDLTGYDVYTAEGDLVVSNLPPSSLSHEFELPSTGYGGEHRFLVRAHRLACANCSGPEAGAQLASPMSQPASVTFTEPSGDPGDPGEDPGDPGTDPGDPGTDPGDGSGGNGYNGDNPGNGSGGNGGSGGSGGSGGGGTTPGTDANGYNNGTTTGGDFSSGQTRDEATQAAQKKLAFGLTFKSFAPKLGAPKLPPLPQFAPPTEQIPWGTYDPTLNYNDQTVVDTEKIASGGGITDTLVDSIGTVFEGERLFRSIAVALLLLLAAGHLRVWLRSNPVS